MIRQYLYISTAPSLSREEVDTILATSERNNTARGVTGLLLYNGRNFLQLLEGEESELVALITRISHDERHGGVSVLNSLSVPERACPDWAMRRIMIGQSVEQRKAVLEAELPENLDPGMRQIIVNFATLN